MYIFDYDNSVVDEDYRKFERKGSRDLGIPVDICDEYSLAQGKGTATATMIGFPPPNARAMSKVTEKRDEHVFKSSLDFPCGLA